MTLPIGLLDVEVLGEASLSAITALTRLRTLISEMPVISRNNKSDSRRYTQVIPALRHF